MVAEGRDVISEFPIYLGWDLRPVRSDPYVRDKSYARTGGFVDGVGDFYPAFFGIVPSEALAMDPLASDAVGAVLGGARTGRHRSERAARQRTGASAGLIVQGYRMSAEEIEGYRPTGTTSSVATGGRRCAGPGMPAVRWTPRLVVAVALHMAVQSLRWGECDLALAGGATVNAAPTFSSSSAGIVVRPRRPMQAYAGAAHGEGCPRAAPCCRWNGSWTLSGWGIRRWPSCAVRRSIRTGVERVDGAERPVAAAAARAARRLLDRRLVTLMWSRP